MKEMKLRVVMKKVLHILFGFLLLAACSASLAEELSPQRSRVPSNAVENGGDASKKIELNAESSLSDYLAHAALHNPGLEAAFNRWKAAAEQAKGADALPNPTFTYTHFIEEVETRAGPQQYKVGLMQRFPWFGTLRAREDAASKAADAAYQEYTFAKLSLFYEVKRAYYEFDYLHRVIAVTEDNIQLVSQFEEVAQARLRAGESQTAVIKAQVELGKLENRLQSLIDLKHPLAAALNAALNRPMHAELYPPRSIRLQDAEYDEEALSVSLLENNPELKALEHQIAGGEEGVKLARKAGYPNFALGVDYIGTDEALTPGSPDSGDDPLMVMASVSLPLWRGSIRSGIEAAERRREAAERMREEKENALQASLQMALYRFRDADRKVKLYGGELLPQARQSLNVHEKAYRNGTMDFLNLVDAERLLLEFQLAYERSLTDRNLALADVERLVGTPLMNE
jgi:outer membrane protein TolC